MKYLAWVWLALNLMEFVLMGVDKFKAIRGKWRIPEKYFFILALLGGAPGALIGMYSFRHKTLHKTFTWGMPAILLLHILLIGLAAYFYFSTGHFFPVPV